MAMMFFKVAESIPCSLEMHLPDFSRERKRAEPCLSGCYSAVSALRNTGTNRDAEGKRWSPQSGGNEAPALTVIHAAPRKVSSGSTQYYLFHLTYNSKQI